MLKLETFAAEVRRMASTPEQANWAPGTRAITDIVQHMVRPQHGLACCRQTFQPVRRGNYFRKEKRHEGIVGNVVPGRPGGGPRAVHRQHCRSLHPYPLDRGVLVLAIPWRRSRRGYAAAGRTAPDALQPSANWRTGMLGDEGLILGRAGVGSAGPPFGCMEPCLPAGPFGHRGGPVPGRILQVGGGS